MIVDLKPYPSMKDSGIPWIGDVPAHWELKRAKWLFRKMNRHVRDGDEVVTCFRDGTVTLRKNRRVSGFTEALKEIGYQGIRRGDLVIHVMDAFAGAIGVSDSDGKGTPVYSVCEPTSVANAHYYAYTLREMGRSQWIQALAKGIRERSTDFRFDSFGNQFVAQPPLKEQADIVCFLDHVDRRIQRYIHAKRTLLKLLGEQKQVIVHHAVTRGTDLNIRLKSSDVTWLKDIPEHWSIWRAKLLLRQVVPRIPDNAETVTCFRDGQVTLRRNRRTEGFTNAIKELGYQGIKPGQLVLHSMDAFAGAIGVSDSEGKCSPEYVICEPATDNVFLPYYAYLLRSLALRGLFVVLCPSVRERAPRVRFSHFGSFVLPNPPIDEQKKIVDHIQAACYEVDQTLNTTRREIDLLREYRTRLISNVVTGKLDVRDAAANLPDVATDEDEFASEVLGEDDGGEEFSDLAGEADED